MNAGGVLNTCKSNGWAAVESDLNDAISMNALPSKKNKDDQETGMRVTQEVAKSYLGKAYLFQKKYQEAAIVLNEVVASDPQRSA